MENSCRLSSRQDKGGHSWSSYQGQLRQRMVARWVARAPLESLLEPPADSIRWLPCLRWQVDTKVGATTSSKTTRAPTSSELWWECVSSSRLTSWQNSCAPVEVNWLRRKSRCRPWITKRQCAMQYSVSSLSPQLLEPSRFLNLASYVASGNEEKRVGCGEGGFGSINPELFATYVQLTHHSSAVLTRHPR